MRIAPMTVLAGIYPNSHGCMLVLPPAVDNEQIRAALTQITADGKTQGIYDDSSHVITLISSEPVLNAVSLFWTLLGYNGVAVVMINTMSI